MQKRLISLFLCVMMFSIITFGNITITSAEALEVIGNCDANFSNLYEKTNNITHSSALSATALATYDYMATSSQIKGAFIVTFRKEL